MNPGMKYIDFRNRRITFRGTGVPKPYEQGKWPALSNRKMRRLEASKNRKLEKKEPRK